MDDYDYLYKVILVGDSGVGKSNLLSRLIRGSFNLTSKATIGVEFGTRSLKIDNVEIKAQVWDTAGEERYKSITKSYYKGSMGAIVVFDLTRPQTFQNCDHWVTELHEAAGEIPIILVGNKVDMVDNIEVDEMDVQKFLHKFDGSRRANGGRNNVQYIKTSALTAENVEDMFVSLMKETHRKEVSTLGKNGISKRRLPNGVPLNIPKLRSKGKGCCG